MAHKKWIVGGFIIVAVVIAMAYSTLKVNSVYFLYPDEAASKAGDLANQDIRVAGMVKSGTIQRNSENHTIEFVLTDLNQTDISVIYKGVPPDMFKEDSGVVVEGRIAVEGNRMVAHQLMVKHSEEYQQPDAQHSLDKELMRKSMGFEPK